MFPWAVRVALHAQRRGLRPSRSAPSGPRRTQCDLCAAVNVLGLDSDGFRPDILALQDVDESTFQVARHVYVLGKLWHVRQWGSIRVPTPSSLFQSLPDPVSKHSQPELGLRVRHIRGEEGLESCRIVFAPILAMCPDTVDLYVSNFCKFHFSTQLWPVVTRFTVASDKYEFLVKPLAKFAKYTVAEFMTYYLQEADTSAQTKCGSTNPTVQRSRRGVPKADPINRFLQQTCEARASCVPSLSVCSMLWWLNAPGRARTMALGSTLSFGCSFLLLPD